MPVKKKKAEAVKRNPTIHERASLSNWVKNAKNIFAQEKVVLSANTKQHRKTQLSKVKTALEQWIRKCQHKEVMLNGPIVREQWQNFARMAEVPEDN
ncbi:hypothetical protein JCM11251_003242 [Rhodosporidiobolus azoricus]